MSGERIRIGYCYNSADVKMFLKLQHHVLMMRVNILPDTLLPFSTHFFTSLMFFAKFKCTAIVSTLHFMSVICVEFCIFHLSSSSLIFWNSSWVISPLAYLSLRISNALLCSSLSLGETSLRIT